MKRAHSRIRTRLFWYFSCVALSLGLLVYLLMYLTLSPQLRRAAYQSLMETTNARMATIDQSVHALNAVSVAIMYSPSVRDALDRVNAQGRLPHDALRDLTAQLVELNGPMLPAAQIRLYSESGIMVASGMVNGQYTFDAENMPWMAEVRAQDGTKVLSLPEADSALLKYNRYIALRRVFKHSRRSLGVIEVVQDAGKLLRGASAGDQMNIYLFDADGAVVFPVGGELPAYVREAVQMDAASGMHELHDELVTWRHSDVCDWTLATVMTRAAALAPLNTLTHVTLWVLALLLALTLALSYVASRQFTRPIHDLAGRMARFHLERGEEPPHERHGPDELDELSDDFDALTRRLNQSVNDLMLTKQQELQSHMLALQSQMNPHFLYNTLSNLSALVEIGSNERAVVMIENISQMLRYIGADDAPTVRIADEIAHLRDYIECMKLRYGANLVAEIRISEEAMALNIPKLSIQPLVENAIKYGCTTQPPWHIRVAVDCAAGGWRVSVTDDGAGFDHHTLAALIQGIQQVREHGVTPSLRIGGMGLYIIAMRLKLFAGDDFLFHIQNLDSGGTQVIIGNRRGGENS